MPAHATKPQPAEPRCAGVKRRPAWAKRRARPDGLRPKRRQVRRREFTSRRFAASERPSTCPWPNTLKHRQKITYCYIAKMLYNDLVMQNLDTTFAALADPTRRAILARLALGEASVNELAAPFAMSQPAISRHLKVLESAGLLARRVEGTKRPCRLAIEGLGDMEEFLAMLRKTLEANYRRLDALLAEMTATPNPEPTPTPKKG